MKLEIIVIWVVIWCKFFGKDFVYNVKFLKNFEFRDDMVYILMLIWFYYFVNEVGDRKLIVVIKVKEI